MSDISIPGVSSKYNTTKLINDLVEAEKIPLKRMEEKVDNLEETRTIWRQVKQEISALQRASKSLYGFENPFSDKTAESSNERILTASATRTAPFDSYTVTVRQIASSDRFMTTSLDKNYRIEEGAYRFKVGDNEISLKYRGGSLEDFARRLNMKGEGIIRTTTVRDTPNTAVMMIEAIPTGSKNRLVFEEDSIKLGLKTGMMKKAEIEQITPDLNTLKENPLSMNGVPVSPSALEIKENSILVKPGTSLTIPFGKNAEINSDMVLEYSYRIISYNDNELEPPVPPGPEWPAAPGAKYEDITIKGSAVYPEIPAEKEWNPPKRVDNDNFFAVEGPENSINLPPAANSSGEFTTVTIPASMLPEEITALVIDNKNTHRGIEVTGIKIYNKNQQGNLVPAHPVSTASDAVLDFRGIEVSRPGNTIDDLIDGLTLNLKRASDEPVDIKIEPDTENAKEGIIKFVYNYNQLLTKILVLTTDNQGVIDELEYLDDAEREKLDKQLGKLRGDLSLNQLKNRMQTIIASPYPTRAEEKLTMLAQIGISTNASSGNTGGTMDYSKLRGYLEIDEEKLDAALENNIEAVKDLFGRDTSGDMIIDNGAAKKIDEFISPYTRTGGLVSIRLDRIEGQIDDTKDDIDDYKQHLDDYEANLKRQYGTMEAMLNQLEQSSKDLDNFSRQQGGGR